MSKKALKAIQNTLRNDLVHKNPDTSSLATWLEAYLELEVTTLDSSRKVQRRDLQTFLAFMKHETGGDRCELWTPRLSQAFKVALQKTLLEDGARRWNDRTVNRILAHLKTFAKWVHKHRPFPLGDPVARVKSIPTASLLEIERALTATERRQLLDAADLLLETGGRSKDRRRHGSADRRPVRKGYRPYRNRAIVYALIETGMRRAAAAKVNLLDVDFDKHAVSVEEKGGVFHAYKISGEGLQAIRDYVDKERTIDVGQFKESPTLFLPAHTTQNRDGQLSVNAINQIWNEVCEKAGVKGKTPHSARHAMGRHIIEKTGNIAAVQRQLGHKNAAYSLQYARVTSEELGKVLDERE